MNIIDYLTLIIKFVKNRKLRTYLTIIGIIIGVTALVSLLLLGDQLNHNVTKIFDQFGTNRIFVAPKNVGFGGPPSGFTSLTEKDVKVLEKLSFLEYVSYMLNKNLELEYRGEKKTRSVFGVSVKDLEKSFSDLDIKLSKGRWFTEKEKFVVVIGSKVAADLFNKELKVNNNLKINGYKFKIVGIIEPLGNRQFDYAIRIPIETMRLITGEKNSIHAITAQVKKGIDIELAAKKIYSKLKKARNDENFRVTNPQQIKQQTSFILNILTYILSLIAIISIIVGGIGITNSMYTSVLERTRQIGTMKALGCSRKKILILFLLESGILGLIGGIIGCILGVILSLFFINLINSLGFLSLDFIMNYNYLIFSLSLSFFSGIISGFIPALQAANLNPIDALRYE